MASSIPDYVIMLRAALRICLKLSFALRRQGTAVPGCYFHVHLLVYRGCDVEFVVCAGSTVRYTSAVVSGRIQGQVVSTGHIVHIEV